MEVVLKGSPIRAYIVTSYDEHQNQKLDERDKRIQFISGFTGNDAIAVVTLESAALWVDVRDVDQAERELDCGWKIFKHGEYPSISEWLTVSKILINQTIFLMYHLFLY